MAPVFTTAGGTAGTPPPYPLGAAGGAGGRPPPSPTGVITGTVPVDLAAANQIIQDQQDMIRDIKERSQRQIDSLTSRLDSMASMMNSLMLAQSDHRPAPNITGWPPASGFNPLIPPPSFGSGMGLPFSGSSSVASSVSASVPSSRVHPSTLPSFGSYQPASSSFQPAASRTVTISTAGAGGAAASAAGGGSGSDIAGLSDSSHHAGARRPPRGDANDSDDDDEELGSSGSGSRGSRRGRGRMRLPRRQSRHQGSEEEDDPQDDYAVNRENLETGCKSLPIKQFNPEDKNQDFDIWISQFEDAVNRGHNPHSKRRHHNYCLRWLPSYLNPDAYVVMRRCTNRNDWEALKKELQAEFEDPTIRVEWRSNLKAYVWDENKESLTTYCSKVKRYVDTFDTDIADVPKAKKNQYYIRFFSGLPTDYQKQIKMGTSSRKQDVDRALDVCLRYHSVKKEGGDKKLDVGAAVTFQDATVPSRVTQCETDIIRLKNRLGKYEQEQSSQYSNGNRYSNYRSPQRGSDYGRDSSMSSDSSQSRQQDRMNRFNAWKRGNQQRSSFRGHSPRGQFRPYRNQQHPVRQNHQPQTGAGSNQTVTRNGDDSKYQKSQLASLEEGFALQSELESEAEELDDTICQFAADYEEREKQAFMAFCAEKDGDLCVPGNY